MTSIRKLGLAALALAAAPAFAAPTTIDFEGTTSFASVGNYYNGVGGPNWGISFTDSALALSNDALGPYFSHAPTNGTVMFAADQPTVMNVAAGFTGELSFWYSAQASELDVVTIYGGANGTGAELGSVSLSKNAQLGGCTDSAYCNWQRITLSFTGTAQSVAFGGVGNAAFDNITVNTVSAVPEPATFGMLAFGLAGLSVVARRQRRS